MNTYYILINYDAWFLFLVEPTSKVTLEIESRDPEKRKIIETLTDISFSILNKIVGVVNEMTSESDIYEIYESIAVFIQVDQNEPKDMLLQNLLKTLNDKITPYAELHRPNQNKIQANFHKFNLRIKKDYEAHIDCSNSRFLVIFSSRLGYELYQKDLENGRIGEHIMELFLYPPFLESFGLNVDDMKISLNGSLLTRHNGKKVMKHPIMLICFTRCTMYRYSF